MKKYYKMKKEKSQDHSQNKKLYEENYSVYETEEEKDFVESLLEEVPEAENIL